MKQETIRLLISIICFYLYF